MRFYSSLVALATTPLWNPILFAKAAPEAPDAFLTAKLQAFLDSQGVKVNASIQASSGGNSSSTLSCVILNSYRNNDLVTAQDGQIYTTEAQQHWYSSFDPLLSSAHLFFIGHQPLSKRLIASLSRPLSPKFSLLSAFSQSLVPSMLSEVAVIRPFLVSPAPTRGFSSPCTR